MKVNVIVPRCFAINCVHANYDHHIIEVCYIRLSYGAIVHLVPALVSHWCPHVPSSALCSNQIPNTHHTCMRLRIHRTRLRLSKPNTPNLTLWGVRNEIAHFLGKSDHYRWTKLVYWMKLTIFAARVTQLPVDSAFVCAVAHDRLRFVFLVFWNIWDDLCTLLYMHSHLVLLVIDMNVAWTRVQQ